MDDNFIVHRKSRADASSQGYSNGPTHSACRPIVELAEQESGCVVKKMYAVRFTLQMRRQALSQICSIEKRILVVDVTDTLLIVERVGYSDRDPNERV